MKKVLLSLAALATIAFYSCSSGDCRTCTKSETVAGTTTDYEVTACKNGDIITKVTIDGDVSVDTMAGPAQTDASLDAWVNTQEGQGWNCN